MLPIYKSITEKKDSFQIGVGWKFYLKTKIYNLEWIVWGMTRGHKKKKKRQQK